MHIGSKRIGLETIQHERFRCGVIWSSERWDEIYKLRVVIRVDFE